jgi:DNA-binding NarL/FixJ family response regulator
MKQFNIILIGEYRLIGDACASMLRNNPEYTVLAAVSSCSDSSLAGLRPDLVIVQGNVARTEGPDLVICLKKMFPGARIMGILMEANTACARAMIRTGMKAYLTSGSSVSEIFRAIESLRESQDYVCEEIREMLSPGYTSEQDTAPDSLDRFYLLSTRELQIVGFVKKGATSKDIASVLNITYRTVETHRYNILKKLQIKNSMALVNYMSAGERRWTAE